MHNEISGGVLNGPVVMGRTVNVQMTVADGRWPVPRQLRRPPSVFENRTAEWALTDAGVEAGAVVVVWGPGGVGKTAFALSWLHANQERFPDGQLCVDLAGHTESPRAVPDALGELLRGLGVAAEVLPATLHERQSLYLSHLAGRRCAVLVENAATAAQVRALVPPAPSVLLVTSRSRLTGLTVDEVVADVPLRALDQRATVALLRRLVGEERGGREPAAVTDLGALSGGYPLAVRILGAQVRARPTRSIAATVRELGDDMQRLARLEIPEGRSMPATFDASYRRLTPPVAALYRALGSHPTPEFSVDVAAAALDATRAEVGGWLAVLADNSLVEEVAEDRYRFHELVWLHARRQACDDDSAAARAAVADRILTWYLRWAAAMDLAVQPDRWREGAVFGQVAAAEVDRAAALAALDREAANLRAAVEQAGQRAGAGRDHVDAHLWQLCVALWGLYFDRRYYGDWIATHTVGIDAAGRLGDRLAEAKLRCQRGIAYLEQGRAAEAGDDFAQALAAARACGAAQALATSLESLGLAALRRGRYGEARARFDEAWELARTRRLGPRALGLLRHHRGRALSGCGEHEAALAELGGALETMRQIGDRYNEGRVLTSIGEAYRRVDDGERAAPAWRQALDIMRAESAFQCAQVAMLLADLSAAMGDLTAERAHLTEAFSRYESLRAAQAAEVAARLAPRGAGGTGES